MQLYRFFFPGSDTEGPEKSGWRQSHVHRDLRDDFGASLLTVGDYSPDIPTRRKRGTVPFQRGEDICPQPHSSLTPYVPRREMQHTPAGRHGRSKTNKWKHTLGTCDGESRCDPGSPRSHRTGRTVLLFNIYSYH